MSRVAKGAQEMSCALLVGVRLYAAIWWRASQANLGLEACLGFFLAANILLSAAKKTLQFGPVNRQIVADVEMMICTLPLITAGYGHYHYSCSIIIPLRRVYGLCAYEFWSIEFVAPYSVHSRKVISHVWC